MSVLSHIRAKGGNVVRDGYAFRLRPGRLDDHAIAWIKQNIEAIKAEVWPDYYEWAERAAIMEYDGGLTRADAELAALQCVEGRNAQNA